MESLMRDLAAARPALPAAASSPLPPGLGGDPASPMGQQAAAVWQMLESMSQRDPAAYRSFIEKMQRDAQSDGAATAAASAAAAPVLPTAGLCVRVLASGRREPRAADVLRPAARTTRPEAPPELMAGHVVHVNVCTHERVLPPLDLDSDAGRRGRSVLEVERALGRPLAARELGNLEVPLGVDDVRRLPRSVRHDAAAAAAPAWAVDCLVHPWVLLAAGHDADFKRVFADFVLASVGEELGVNFDASSVRFDRAAYVGGAKRAGGAEEPLPFNRARLSTSGGSAGGGAGISLAPGADSGANIAAKLLGRAAPPAGATGASSGATHGTANTLLSSPATLLQHLKASDTAEAPARGLLGLHLSGDEPGGAADAAAGATAGAAASPEAAAAASFAQVAAAVFPEEHLVHHGACTVVVSLDEGTAAGAVAPPGGGEGSVVVRIEFDGSAVDLAALQLGECELDVEAERLRLRLPRRLLRAYSGLTVPLVLVVAQALPTRVDPAGARARFARKGRALTVTIPVCR